jgi:putative SOS response-associated peptidase YedK
VCNRFTYVDATSLAALFEMPAWPEGPPRHNVAPTQGVPTVRWNTETADREVRWMRCLMGSGLFY